LVAVLGVDGRRRGHLDAAGRSLLLLLLLLLLVVRRDEAAGGGAAAAGFEEGVALAWETRSGRG